ncbi:HlyD family type I secretion periplasmic adaptor subunit [Novosphingobium sp. SG707]|uniref:HlyD family type I secretion periplasmic adaptor subunit n=1 Tax=Novosphingobium sp. SG707 TaxID=2586996 RepID=UPI001447CB61|nr:HlyD family type I secretion periplasmic adaptor subunit [Novosphingobium sp. SG707]NKJ02987.1 hemolysin D [Novosphingobium sp. SG707]
MSLAHHWRVIRAALKADKERARAHQRSHETTFLPAALEVVERPVSPTGRYTVWALIVFLVITLVWLVFGRVDVVASAPGKILPSGATKIVQSAGSGVVAAIHVRDGDHVTKGQVLIELDTTLATAELEQAKKALLADELEVARNRAFVDALDGRGLHFAAPEGTPADVAVAQRQLISAQLAEVNSTVVGYGAARASSLADAQAAAATRAKLDETLPILDHEVEAMNRLDAKGYAPGMRLLDLQRQRRSEQGDRDVAVAQQLKGASDAAKFAEQMREARDTARRQAMTELTKAQADAIVKREEVTKATRRAGLEKLTAPTDGTVQQLQLHTIGGVVEPARTLMVIVPEHDDIEVEARILNKDVGFVREGQGAAIKIEAFPFTRYGSVPGTVVSMSRDAVPDPKLGATYIVRVRLSRATITVDGKPVPLSSGMGVTADIRTGSRAIISWLISPIMTTVHQAARER